MGITTMKSWLEVIQTILDGIKMSGNPNQNLVSIRKKILLSGLCSEYTDLAKFAEDTDSYLFGEELEDSLKKAKGRHYSLQALKPKPPIHASTKQKFKKQQGHLTIQLTKHMGRIEKTVQQKKPLQTSETWEELKEPQIKKLRAEIDFSINNMVSYHIPMETLKSRGGKI